MDTNQKTSRAKWSLTTKGELQSESTLTHGPDESLTRDSLPAASLQKPLSRNGNACGVESASFAQSLSFLTSQSTPATAVEPSETQTPTIISALSPSGTRWPRPSPGGCFPWYNDGCLLLLWAVSPGPHRRIHHEFHTILYRIFTT